MKKTLGLKAIATNYLFIFLGAAILCVVTGNNSSSLFGSVGIAFLVILIQAYFSNFFEIHEDFLKVRRMNPFVKSPAIKFSQLQRVEMRAHQKRYASETTVFFLHDGTEISVSTMSAVKDLRKLKQILQEKLIDVQTSHIDHKNPWDKDYFQEIDTN